MSDSKALTLAEANAAREERKAVKQAAADAQAAIDVLAISEIEEELGDASVKVLVLPHKPPHATRAAVRCATRAEIKRYRDQTKPDKKGRPGDAAAANEMLGDACRVYPKDAEAFEALCEAFPGLLAQMGVHAANLATADEEETGKS